MSQDTRKDKRAKVVSLNVRYKSATVDEFIENHSHDVSKGGLFVKTPTPFPPGTLLKFEIRLAGDKSVISGVGRVVWKREPTQAGAEKPAGMGVKFIKIDDSSRAIIDRLVAEKQGAGSAYDSEKAVDDIAQPEPAQHPSTLRGLVAAPVAESQMETKIAKVAPITAPAPSSPGSGGKLPVPPAASPPAASLSPAFPAARGGGLASTLIGPKPGGPVQSATTALGVGAQASKAPVPPASQPKVPPAAPSSKDATATAGAKAAARPLGGPAPATIKPATVIGVGPNASSTGTSPGVGATAKTAGKPASEPKLPGGVPPAGAAAPPRPMPPQRKATMMGMGIASIPPAAGSSSSVLPAPTPPPPPPE